MVGPSEDLESAPSSWRNRWQSLVQHELDRLDSRNKWHWTFLSAVVLLAAFFAQRIGDPSVLDPRLFQPQAQFVILAGLLLYAFALKRVVRGLLDMVGPTKSKAEQASDGIEGDMLIWLVQSKGYPFPTRLYQLPLPLVQAGIVYVSLALLNDVSPLVRVALVLVVVRIGAGLVVRTLMLLLPTSWAVEFAGWIAEVRAANASEKSGQEHGSNDESRADITVVETNGGVNGQLTERRIRNVAMPESLEKKFNWLSRAYRMVAVGVATTVGYFALLPIFDGTSTIEDTSLLFGAALALPVSLTAIQILLDVLESQTKSLLESLNMRIAKGTISESGCLQAFEAIKVFQKYKLYVDCTLDEVLEACGESSRPDLQVIDAESRSV